MRLHASLQILEPFEQVTHFAFFGLQIAARGFRNTGLAGNSFHHLDPAAFQLPDFFRIIREQADFLCAKFIQDLRGEIVIARVRGEPQFLIGFHRIHSAVLKFVSAKLIHQADAAAFLWQIEKYAGGSLPDFLERQFELCAAIAAQRRKDISSKTLRMHAYQRRNPALQIASNQSHPFFHRAAPFESVNGKAAVTRR